MCDHASKCSRRALSVAAAPLLLSSCRQADGIIFMCDASDADRIPEAAQELRALLSCVEVSEVPVAVFANKSELKVRTEIRHALQAGDAEGRSEGRRAHVFRCLWKARDLAQYHLLHRCTDDLHAHSHSSAQPCSSVSFFFSTLCRWRPCRAASACPS